jgi:hypothetical protein
LYDLIDVMRVDVKVEEIEFVGGGAPIHKHIIVPTNELFA